MSKDAEQLVGLIREIIKDEIKSKDAATICSIAGVNPNGTLNITLLSDPDTIVSNIYNCTPYNFSTGDAAILYKINNNLNNSFIIAKPTTEEPSRVSMTSIQNYVSQNFNSSSADPLKFYPVGSVYISVNETNPAEIFGGEWEQIKDRFLLAAGDTYTSGEIGGEEKHTLTIEEMPSHDHLPGTLAGVSQPYFIQHAIDGPNKVNLSTGDLGAMIIGVTANTGGGNAHNNMPPYLAVYMWKRTK